MMKKVTQKNQRTTTKMEGKNYIGLKWIVLPIPVKDIPIFRYPVYYSDVNNTIMYKEDYDTHTWKQVYNVEDNL